MFGPHVGFQFREDEHAIHINFEGTKSRILNKILCFLIEVLVLTNRGFLPQLPVMQGNCVPVHNGLRNKCCYFGSQAIEIILVFGLIMSRTPWMQMTLHTSLHFDMDSSFGLMHSLYWDKYNIYKLYKIIYVLKNLKTKNPKILPWDFLSIKINILTGKKNSTSYCFSIGGVLPETKIAKRYFQKL